MDNTDEEMKIEWREICERVRPKLLEMVAKLHADEIKKTHELKLAADFVNELKAVARKQKEEYEESACQGKTKNPDHTRQLNQHTTSS